MYDFALRVLDPISLAGVLIALWVAVMISVPIVRWIGGEGAEHIGIAAGVFAQVAAVVAVLFAGYGAGAVIVIIAVPVLGWVSEVVGSRAGVPFGPYHYTDVLQPQVARVPVLIPLAWLMMMPPSWAVGAVVAPNTPVLQWVVAAGAFAAWDVYLDPMMVRWRFWEWRRKGFYEGIPLVNFLGWFAVAFAITALLAFLGRTIGVALVSGVPSAPLILVYAVTWLLMFVGQMLFWKLRVSAVAGFVAMGLFVVLVVSRVGL
ncbi:MAG: carotenoid biosynthesis protein [Spirochaetota bacterium]